MELLDELNRHVADLLARCYSTEDFIGFLCDWFAGHTAHEDRKFFSDNK